MIDLLAHKIYLHPLYTDYKKTLRTLNKDKLTPYTGEYPDEAFIKMPIAHSDAIFTKNHLDITNNKINWYSSGGTSHKIWEKLICKKEEKNMKITKDLLDLQSSILVRMDTVNTFCQRT